MKHFDPAVHEDEVQERWGDTDAYRESSRRTRQYSDEDWRTIKAELESVESGFAEAMSAGAPADGERATDLAEEARLRIDRWYYACSHEMHAALAEMYMADGRFRAHYEDRAAGLAEYVAAAIRANAARAQD